MALGDSIAASDLANTAGRSPYLLGQFEADSPMDAGVGSPRNGFQVVTAYAEFLLAAVVDDVAAWRLPVFRRVDERVNESYASEAAVALSRYGAKPDPARRLVAAIFNGVVSVADRLTAGRHPAILPCVGGGIQ